MKEKRILCVEVSGDCQCLMDVNRPSLAFLCGCPAGLYCTKNISWKPITKDACKNCKEGRYQGFTRKQTIYKIAKAICKTDGGKCKNCSLEKIKNGCAVCLQVDNYIMRGEAALNALLGGEKDDER